MSVIPHCSYVKYVCECTCAHMGRVTFNVSTKKVHFCHTVCNIRIRLFFYLEKTLGL